MPSKPKAPALDRLVELEAEVARLNKLCEQLRKEALDALQKMAAARLRAALERLRDEVREARDRNNSPAFADRGKVEPGYAEAMDDVLPDIEEIISGDDSALKARMDAAREEGRLTAEANIYSEPNLDLCRERDSLRAQSERRLRYITETQQLLGTHDNVQVAVETLLQERDSLRAQLAERDAQVERLRQFVGKVERSTIVGSWRTQGEALLAETPAASLAAVRDQARWDALEEARGSFHMHPEMRCASDSLERWKIEAMLRDLAAQPAKEPQP